jgi:SAM-dependent methyltransferase
MAGTPPQAEPQFNAYAGSYESALQRGVGLSGEDSSFFAQGRVDWLRGLLTKLGAPSHTLLDFGCGNGSTAPLLLELPGAENLIGTDVSDALLEVARREHGSERAEFVSLDELPRGRVDLVYCNGVFHHVAPPKRAVALVHVRDALRPGGLFAMWENNPWNPGTRLVMRRIPFDRDAVTLSAPQTRRMLRASGFEIVRTDFLFVFPRALRALRTFERHLARAPLGAQYLVLARRPGATTES